MDSAAGHAVVILDEDEGQSRLFSLDGDGFHELAQADVAGLAGEVGAVLPDLILVNPAAVDLAGSALADKLNDLLHLHASSYAWDPAPGESPLS